MNRASRSPLPAIGTGSALAIALIAAIIFLGCDMPSRPNLTPSEARSNSAVGFPGGPADPDLTAPEVSKSKWDVWNAHFIGDRHVGYSHSVCKENPDDAGEVLCEFESCYYVPHGRAQVLQRLKQRSAEHSNGKLKDFEASLQVGPIVRRFTGSVDGDSLSVETISGNSNASRQIDWSSEHWGLVAIEQTLRDDPMTRKSSEPRVLKILMPGSYVPATARLTCRGKASVPMLDDSIEELNEIDCEISIDDSNRTYMTMWTDNRGVVMRTLRPALQLVTYQTDRATALDFDGNDEPPVYIAADGSLERPAETERVGYLVHKLDGTSTGERLKKFPTGPGQYVKADRDGSYRVVVTRGEPTDVDDFDALDLKTTNFDARSSKLINSAHPLVKQYAEVAVGPRRLDTRETALALTEAVNRVFVPDARYGGLKRASDTALLGEGNAADCAIFLAAMLRARKIPARLAFGFRYEHRQDGENRFVFDIWTMAYVNEQWIHLDPSTAREAGADRLVLSTSPLNESNEYASVEPFLDLMGRLQVQIQDAEYRPEG